MLGKTANDLFWMSRYIERADNTCRLIDTAQYLNLTRGKNSSNQWKSLVQASGMLSGFSEYFDSWNKENVIEWMLRSKKNNSSVFSIISNARQNARLVRTAITPEVWEAINSTYIFLNDNLKKKMNDDFLIHILKRVKSMSLNFQGATDRTMLHNQILNFINLGTFIERADNTARILDVKYYVLLPSINSNVVDNIQWDLILRSMSARGGYRLLYGHKINSENITKFMILDKRMPRSLLFCIQNVKENLELLRTSYNESQELLNKVRNIETYLVHDISSIFKYGLHEFIQKIIQLNNELTLQIEEDYRFYQ